MTIDHVGIFFFPDVEALRLIGRLSFPLFAFLIANGAYHTKNMKAYLWRLFIFALISQVPFVLAFDTGLNVFFTLLLGLLAIYGIQNTKTKTLRFTIVIACALVALAFGTDYGAGGVLSIVGFYLFYDNLKKLAMVQIIIFTLFFTVPAAIQYIETMSANLIALLQPIATGSVVFIAAYNKKEGYKAKYLFYLFYPIHLLVIYFLWKF